MNPALQDLGLAVIGICILLLALTNMYLVWRLIKGVRFEDEKLDSIAANGQQILSQQLTVRHIVADPGFQSLIRSMSSGNAPTASPVDGKDVDASELDLAMRKSAGQIGESALGMSDLILSFNEAEDPVAWKTANQARIGELLRAQGNLKAEVDQLQTLLTRAHATILNLKARPATAVAEPSAASLAEVDSLKAGIAARDTKIAAAEAVLKNEKTKFEEEKKRLNEKIAEMQAEFDRTLVEKSFIEEAFIEETEGHKAP